MKRIALSDAQVSALECRGLESPFDAEDVLVATAWAAGEGVALVFAPSDAEALFSALTAMSNAESDYAEDAAHDSHLRALARRASRSLGAVASRVLRSS